MPDAASVGELCRTRQGVGGVSAGYVRRCTEPAPRGQLEPSGSLHPHAPGSRWSLPDQSPQGLGSPSVPAGAGPVCTLGPPSSPGPTARGHREMRPRLFPAETPPLQRPRELRPRSRQSWTPALHAGPRGPGLREFRRGRPRPTAHPVFLPGQGSPVSAGTLPRSEC